MKYNFDEIVDRSASNSVKYDALEKYLGVKDAIPMWVADMDFKSPPCVVEAIKKRLEHEIFGYTLRGDEYFEAIVNWMQRRHQWALDKDWISYSPGVVAGLTIAIEQFTQPGDKIMIHSPVYFPFFQSIDGTKRETLYNKLLLKDGRYCIDFDDMEKQMDDKVKMLIMSNPHNPGGSVWTKEELLRLNEICAKHNVMVISDEIHADMVFAPHKHTPYASVSENAANNSITLMAPSKTFNIAGLTTSIVIAENKQILDKFNIGLNTPHLHMGNIFGTEALKAAFNDGEEWLAELMEYLKKNINFVDDFVKSKIPELKVIIPEATYLVWIDCRALNLKEKDLMKLFTEKAKVAMNPGSMFGPGGEGFVRMNVGCPQSVIEKALTQIEKALKE